MVEKIEINGRVIGPGERPYIVAEMSGNHNSDLSCALEMMDAASEAGVDAVKLQTYTPDTLTIDHNGEDFCIRGGLWDGRTLYDLYEEAHTPWAMHEALFNRGKELGLTVFSTPFDETAVHFLDQLHSPIHKVASFEMADWALLRVIAKSGKPVIMSTGMANLEEISDSVRVLQQENPVPLILLHCISAYPAPAAEANLKTMCDLGKRFNLPVGLSDHTLGTAVSVAAVALGACVIEKHFTLARANGGPDSAFSLEPHELKTLVEQCHIAYEALGGVGYDRKPSEEANLTFRRSIYIVQDVAKGARLTPENTRVIRPGYGLAPKYITDVLGKTALRDLKRGDALDWGMIDDKT
ncbi:MAG: pseudaminic acid synthase [Terasakiella sp.]|uniref:pseudaminic acid synthase n=1 Tax=unclassified Terasakiella TaxID=2614952 RepID=UPI003AFFAF84